LGDGALVWIGNFDVGLLLLMVVAPLPGMRCVNRSCTIARPRPETALRFAVAGQP